MDIDDKNTILSVFYYLQKISQKIDIENFAFSFKVFKGIYNICNQYYQNKLPP